MAEKLKIDVLTLQGFIAQYKANFSQHRLEEIYKWKAIKCFQDNWDIDAPDFPAMLKSALAETANLLTSAQFFPRKMIEMFAEEESETVRSMFRSLFDDSRNVTARVEEFNASASKLLQSHPTLKMSYQNPNSISTYLWLRYPDKHYAYKYSVIKDNAHKLCHVDLPNGKLDRMMFGFSLCDAICEELGKDSELISMSRNSLSADCYPDDSLKTLTIDLGYFISKHEIASGTATANEQNKVIEDNINEGYERVPAVDELKAEVVNKRRYWLYSPGEQARLWEDFSQAGIMGIGWDDHGGLGDLTRFGTKADIKTRLKQIGDPAKSYMNDGLALWQFAHEIAIGDIVFAKRGTSVIVGRGVVESDYIFDDSRSEYKHIRKVKWKHQGEWEHPGKANIKMLTDITPYTEYVGQLEALALGEADLSEDGDEPEIKYPDYSESDFLNEVFISAERHETLKGLLARKKNVILQGAPGVGKTFAAQRLAFSMIGKKDTSRVKIVQFHQSYSYEDFIMGYRPDGSGFRLAEGPFYKFCKTAEDDDERDYFFIIDEINRGNLSKIFGELLMLIEGDKRGEENALRLLYKDEQFFVPDNVYIIGMMNTADRSLAMIDYALRRRFAFFDMEPAFASEGFKAHQKVIQNPKFDALIATVLALNQAIGEDTSLGVGFRIGHSYFCADIVDDAWLSSVIEYELVPLLNEYWFDEPSKVESWTAQLRSAVNG